MGSTSGTLAAVIRVWSLSACDLLARKTSSGAVRKATDGDLDAIVGEDQGGVGSGLLLDGHFGGCRWVLGRESMIVVAS